MRRLRGMWRYLLVWGLVLGTLGIACVSPIPTTPTPVPTRAAAPSPPTATPVPTATPTPAPTSVPIVNLRTLVATPPAAPTASLPLSPLPFGRLLFEMGYLGRDETLNIYELSPQRQRLWLADQMAKAGIRVSPNDKQVAYIVVEPDGDSIWVAHPNGTAARRLTPPYPLGGDVRYYLGVYGWSADSNEYAYMHTAHYEPFNSQLYIVDVATGLIRSVGEKGLRDADWNPKRPNELLVLRYRISASPCLLDVHTGDCVDLGGEIPRIRRGEGEILGFTPDGEGFYLVDGQNRAIIITGRTGQIQREIHVNARIGTLRWSSDGQRLLIGVYDNRQLTDVYVMGSQATTWRRVVSSVSFREPDDDPDITYLKLGSWSPDGGWFTVQKHRLRGSGTDIYVCRVSTGEIRKVVTTELEIYEAVWLP